MNTPEAEQLPTVEQLATLAAMLARGPDDRPDGLAARALALWRASGVALWRDSSARRQAERNLAKFRTLPPPAETSAGGPVGTVTMPQEQRHAALDAIAKRPRFPVAADKFAGLVVPKLKGRTDEAADAIKGWLWWLERKRLSEQAGVPMHAGEDCHAEAVQPVVDALFAKWRRHRLRKSAFEDLADSFALWYTHQHAAKHAAEISAVRRKSGRKGGNASAKARAKSKVEPSQEKRLTPATT
ncbi:MAG TPA: hypothetical protein PKM73_05685 [Verrucomicrobiota bacterium]|nr:hypothetical protein [Verrucomicrobiota bacterium]